MTIRLSSSERPLLLKGLRKARPDATLVEVRLTKSSARAFTLEWDTRSAGWGSVSFRQTPEGLECESRGKDRSFVSDVLHKFVEQRTMKQCPEILQAAGSVEVLLRRVVLGLLGASTPAAAFS